MKDLMSDSITYMYRDPYSDQTKRLKCLITQLEKVIPDDLRKDEFSNICKFVSHFSQLKDAEQRLELERFVQYCQQAISYALHTEQHKNYYQNSKDYYENRNYYLTLKDVDYYAKLDPHLINLQNNAIVGLFLISLLLMDMFESVSNGTTRVLTKNQSMFLVCASVIGTCLLARPILLPSDPGIAASAEKFSLWVRNLELKLEGLPTRKEKCKV